MGILSGVFGSKKQKAVPQLDVENRFELLSKPISGSMGTYQKLRDKTSKKVYGIKILDSEKTDHFRQKFKGVELPSEAEVTSNVNHDNVVKLLDSGKTTEGKDFLLLEHCEGARLDEAIRLARQRSVRPKIILLLDMIRAVGATHEAGFIHRDICPKNFYLDVKSDRIKLFDFGLSLPNQAEFFVPGVRTGSTMYVAPEIVRRKAYDSRADIFSLGVTMFELLSGQHPWESCSSSLSFDAKEPVSLAKFCPNLSEKIIRAIHCCIEIDPEKRYSSTKQLLFTVRSALK